MDNSYDSVKIGVRDILFYFVFIPFLYPRGFAEFNTGYKLFFTIWIWAAVVIIWMQFILHLIPLRLKINKTGFCLSLYFILAILITIIKRDTISSGLQQMVATPSLCVFIISNFEKYWRKILDTLLNIFIVLFLLNGIFFRDYFDQYVHIGFFGHVQAMSQIGLVAIFSATLNYMLTKGRKLKTILLLILVAFTLFNTNADSAVLVIVMLIVAGVIYKWRLYHLLCFKSKWYIVFGFLMSVFFIYTTVNNLWSGLISDYTFSGRSFVWENAMSRISESYLFGFGIDGVFIKTFWTEWTGGGFNYAHNQILQNLLDGGIVLCVAFFMMMFAYVSYIDKLEEKRFRVLSNAVLISFFMVMIFDSTTIYCYMYIFLTMLVKLPQVVNEGR